jgi:uncharacterized protein YjbI with pentapeptide repeats
MANDEHLAVLRRGVNAWNRWRRANPDVSPDLSGANLHGANLIEADLRGARLVGAELSQAALYNSYLVGANLRWANLAGADLHGAVLAGANLTEANLQRANFRAADLTRARLQKADLGEAELEAADLAGANLSEAALVGARLVGADLAGTSFQAANLTGAVLHRADLIGANLIEANLRNADLCGCRIYGVSAWEVKLDGTKQENLVITPSDQPAITVDNVEVAQFVYLLLHNQKIRHVIDAVTSKAVLILGRFTPERKKVLDALREALRSHDYLPILFDFDMPTGRDIGEAVSLLARMARFIVADLTDPCSIPKELEAIVPDLAVPVQPVIEGSNRPYAMFADYWKYEWVLPLHRYEALEALLATMEEKVIAPAEAKVQALQERRRAIEAELTKVG